jgi:hypothetical protein
VWWYFPGLNIFSVGHFCSLSLSLLYDTLAHFRNHDVSKVYDKIHNNESITMEDNSLVDTSS